MQFHFPISTVKKEPIPTEKRNRPRVIEFPRLAGWVCTFCSELTAVVSFVPCFYFLFLTALAAVIVGLFNISERVRQHPSPGIERNVITTKKEPRLFMFAPKTKHGSPASKTANSALAPTAKADAEKSKHHKSTAGSNGGY